MKTIIIGPKYRFNTLKTDSYKRWKFIKTSNVLYLKMQRKTVFQIRCYFLAFESNIYRPKHLKVISVRNIASTTVVAVFRPCIDEQANCF